MKAHTGSGQWYFYFDFIRLMASSQSIWTHQTPSEVTTLRTASSGLILSIHPTSSAGNQLQVKRQGTKTVHPHQSKPSSPSLFQPQVQDEGLQSAPGGRHGGQQLRGERHNSGELATERKILGKLTRSN